MELLVIGVSVILSVFVDPFFWFPTCGFVLLALYEHKKG